MTMTKYKEKFIKAILVFATAATFSSCDRPKNEVWLIVNETQNPLNLTLVMKDERVLHDTLHPNDDWQLITMVGQHDEHNEREIFAALYAMFDTLYLDHGRLTKHILEPANWQFMQQGQHLKKAEFVIREEDIEP